ncbi:MAG: outer membrane beta-barrel protein [Pseudomonadota bacterium]
MNFMHASQRARGAARTRAWRWALPALLVLTAPLTANAHWQAGPTLIGGATRIGPTTDRGQIGTGAVIDGLVDGALPQESAWDSSAGAGLMLAYRRGPWAIAGEFNWHFRSDWDLSVPTPSLMTVTNVFTNLERASWLLGADRYWSLGDRWQLVAGLRAGVHVNRLRTDYKERAVIAGGRATIIKSSARQRRFSWGADLGVTRDVGERWELDVRYRYFDSGRMQIRPLADPTIRFETDLEEHLLRFSLRYRFR